MKLLPTMNLFDDAFDAFFNDGMFQRVSVSDMKTDVSEKDGYYLLEMELAGYRKEDIHIELNDGYLTICASRNNQQETKDDSGNVIRRERHSGSCSRNFYVGEVCEEDIKARFENGELKISFPSQKVQLAQKSKTICIE